PPAQPAHQVVGRPEPRDVRVVRLSLLHQHARFDPGAAQPDVQAVRRPSGPAAGVTRAQVDDSQYYALISAALISAAGDSYDRRRAPTMPSRWLGRGWEYFRDSGEVVGA